MTSLYPQSRDTMRRVVDGDDAHAQLFKDLFDSIIKVQTELGVKPSGIYGSLYGRIFGSELVSKTCGYWRKLHIRIHNTSEALLRGAFDFPTIVNWATGRMDGTNTNMGDGTPFVFCVYQGRALGSSFYDPGGGGYGSRRLGQPWNLYPFVVKKDQAFIAGVGADFVATYNQGSPPPRNALLGVIAWGLQPSPTQSFQDQ